MNRVDQSQLIFLGIHHHHHHSMLTTSFPRERDMVKIRVFTIWLYRIRCVSLCVTIQPDMNCNLIPTVESTYVNYVDIKLCRKYISSHMRRLFMEGNPFNVRCSKSVNIRPTFVFIKIFHVHIVNIKELRKVTLLVIRAL